MSRPSGHAHATRPTLRGRPHLGRELVVRPRLHAALDNHGGAALTLVSAAAGSGKTTLLLSWLAARPDSRIAWVETPAGDGFWPACADAVAEALGMASVQEEGETPLEALVRTFASLDEPLTLVVDDFHDVESPAVLDLLGRLAEWAPANLHVVLASRRDPGLPLHRLRLAGALGEIRARQLAFTFEEASALFDVSGVDLDPASVRTLLEHTEGWAAALRFAAISLRNRTDAESFVLALARTEQAVSDYLVREVLDSQTPELRDFLLRTSLCERFDADLAEAVTGCRDAARMLEALERDNAFIELQQDGRSYRYHRLFADLLQASARLELGVDAVAVHAAAARSLAAEGDHLAALRHALAAGDFAGAADLVGALWIQLVGRGEQQLVRKLLDGIDADVLLGEPQLCLLAAWQRFAAGDVEEADVWLTAADGAAVDDRAFRVGRSLLALVRGRMTIDAEAIEQALDVLVEPQALAQTTHDGEGRRALAFCARAVVALWHGELDIAETLFEAALETARRARLGAVELDATAMLALTCAFRGELKRASRLAGTTGTVAAPALAALALCELEWDDASEALRKAESARDVAEARGDAAGALIARVVAASAAAAEPDGVEDARLALAALAADGAERLPLLAPWLLALRCRLGDARFASAALAAADPSPQRRVAAARLVLARRDAGAAQVELAELLAVPGGTPLAVLVEAMVLRSLAAALTGSDEDACAWIERALELAEPEAIRRPFLDAGPTVAEVLRHTIRRGSAHRWLAGSLLAVLDGRESPEGHSARELLDPLSDRETIVLRYLPTMMSNQEIAGELFVSVNTIKTHLKSIYRKLGASDRREAVRLARELRLIA